MTTRAAWQAWLKPRILDSCSKHAGMTGSPFREIGEIRGRIMFGVVVPLWFIVPTFEKRWRACYNGSGHK